MKSEAGRIQKNQIGRISGKLKLISGRIPKKDRISGSTLLTSGMIDEMDKNPVIKNICSTNAK